MLVIKSCSKITSAIEQFGSIHSKVAETIHSSFGLEVVSNTSDTAVNDGLAGHCGAFENATVGKALGTLSTKSLKEVH